MVSQYFMAIIVVGILYDIFLNCLTPPLFVASKTHKLLMDMGVDGHVELMCSKIKAYTTSASKYLSK